jgi:hypothetical protein
MITVLASIKVDLPLRQEVLIYKNERITREQLSSNRLDGLRDMTEASGRSVGDQGFLSIFLISFQIAMTICLASSSNTNNIMA